MHRLGRQPFVQQAARSDQLGQVDAGFEAHAFQHEHSAAVGRNQTKARVTPGGLSRSLRTFYM